MTDSHLPFQATDSRQRHGRQAQELQPRSGETVTVRPQSDFVAEEAVEDALSFVEKRHL